MSNVDVRSIDALEELQSDLVRYGERAVATLDAAQREVQRTLDWLDDRVSRLQSEVQRLKEEEHRATSAYQRCLSSVDRRNPPPCDHLLREVQVVRHRLAMAMDAARTATQMRREVQSAVGVYQREAGKLRTILENNTPKAVEALRHKIAALRDYASNTNISSMLPLRFSSLPAEFVNAKTGLTVTDRTETIDTLRPGPFAIGSIPAADASRDFSDTERQEVDELGRKGGCHSCGTKDPGTKSGHFIPDHQPPSAMNHLGQAQKLYPHCIDCSRLQGGQVKQQVQKLVNNEKE